MSEMFILPFSFTFYFPKIAIYFPFFLLFFSLFSLFLFSPFLLSLSILLVSTLSLSTLSISIILVFSLQKSHQRWKKCFCKKRQKEFMLIIMSSYEIMSQFMTANHEPKEQTLLHALSISIPAFHIKAKMRRENYCKLKKILEFLLKAMVSLPSSQKTCMEEGFKSKMTLSAWRMSINSLI